MLPPPQYLEQVAKALPKLYSKSEINEVLDEIESLYETIEREFEDLVGDLIYQLHSKLQSL